MKKKESKIGAAIRKYFKPLHIALSLVFTFIVSGCITPYALDLAERKSSPSISYTDWNISEVKSAVEQENGDISVCVELHESQKTNKSEYYAITLPGSSLLGKTTDLATLGFRGKKSVEHPNGHSPDPYIDDYLYPLAKAKKGCHGSESKKLATDSVLPIVKLTLPEKDRNQLYTLLNELKAQASPEEKLYEVTFLKMEEDSSVEINDSAATKHPNVLLLYWPSEINQEPAQPLGIAGGYESEDESTNLYYLLVPPAAALDAIGLMILAASYRPM